MIIYKVEITIETAIELEALERVHVPDVVCPGCFHKCRIYKVIELDAADPSYAVRYHSQSREEYHRYRDSFSPLSKRSTPIGLPEAFEALASSSKK